MIDAFMLYETYRRAANIIAEYDNYRVLEFSADNVDYVVYELKIKVGKNSRIVCKEDGGIYLKKFYPSGKATPIKEERIICKPINAAGKNVMVLIIGNPDIIVGLDEGIFVSATRNTEITNRILVLTEKEFKHHR